MRWVGIYDLVLFFLFLFGVFVVLRLWLFVWAKLTCIHGAQHIVARITFDDAFQTYVLTVEYKRSSMQIVIMKYFCGCANFAYTIYIVWHNSDMIDCVLCAASHWHCSRIQSVAYVSICIDRGNWIEFDVIICTIIANRKRIDWFICDIRRATHVFIVEFKAKIPFRPLTHTFILHASAWYECTERLRLECDIKCILRNNFISILFSPNWKYEKCDRRVNGSQTFLSHSSVRPPFFFFSRFHPIPLGRHREQ